LFPFQFSGQGGYFHGDGKKSSWVQHDVTDQLSIKADAQVGFSHTS